MRVDTKYAMQVPAPLTSPRIPTAPTPAGAGARASWVPIRSLARRHRGLILTHLLALTPADRYLRFGYAASDEHVRRYVERIDFSRDEVLGIFDRRLALIAVAHLAVMDTEGQGGKPLAEFGVSVLPQARGRGWGSRLFERAALHARNAGVESLVIHALSENTAMLRIARKAGAHIVRDGSESEARLRLPPEDVSSYMGALMAQQAGEFDYQLKLQARRLTWWLDVMADLRDGVAGHPPLG